MRKSSLKQTVKWQKNEAPKGLAQICMGMEMGCLFRIARDLGQPESPPGNPLIYLRIYDSHSLSKETS